MLNLFGEGGRLARRLRRAPGFTALTLLTLAIGIGANTAIFSVIEGVLLKPLPYYQPERLVTVSHTAAQTNLEEIGSSPSTHFTYREENRVFSDLALWRTGAYTITGKGRPERVEGLESTWTLFPVLRVQPVLGRLHSDQDDREGSPETVVLSHGYWQREFGGEPGAIGKRILIDGKAHEVIGVLPRDFRFLDAKPELFFPTRLNRGKVFAGQFSYRGIARLKPGVTLESATADLARVLPMMLDKFPPPPGFTRAMFQDVKLSPALRSLKDDVVGDIGNALWVLMGAVGVVLLIACANVANLFLVRADGRQQELAVRAALGAGRGRLAREFLTESISLAVLGGVLGLGLAYAGLKLLVYLAPSNLPRLRDIGIDLPVLLFTLAISVVSGAFFGLIPMLKYGNGSLSSALKEGGRASSDGRPRHRARNVLVVSQIALALVLLIGAGLMVRTFQALRNVAPGFVRPEEALTFRVPIEQAQIPDHAQVTRTYRQIIERISHIPGVVSVGASSSVTMDGSNNNDPIMVEEFPEPEGRIAPIRRFKHITPGYFAAVGTPILAGRDLTWNDVFGQPTYVLVSENLARQYWKTPAGAIGKRVKESPASPWRTIAGVVADERDDGVHKKAPTVIYWPMLVYKYWHMDIMVQRQLRLVVRSPRTGSPGLLNEIQSTVQSINADLPVTSVRTLDEIYGRSMASTSFMLVMLAIASAVALLLGLIGIYGVVSYSVSQRKREIGIRMALGAEHSEVRGLFVRHALMLTGLGVAVGGAAAIAVTRAMAALLYGVSALDPLTFAGVAALLTVAALLASYLPARRATTVDPARALRAE